ncbi:MAG: helix-turn-helix domain-containing protein [Candidatus Sulfotelmatobacter sp.]
MEAYPRAAMERAMKVQDVMLQAMAKKITWWQAAEILGISDRHMRRWRERYVEEGYNGLLDRRRGQPSRRRVAVATVEKVFALYREKYFDLNVQHFHEKLQAEHGIELSYSWVKQALQGAGLVARGRNRGAHRKRRERRPLPGMLLHIDGSRHQWFQDERWYDLIVILDDATSEIYYAQLVEEESTATVMAGLREVIERQGVFCALYSDRGNAFVPCRSRDLERIFSLQFERSVNRDNTVSFQNLSLQIERVRWRATLAGCQVVLHQHLNGTLSLTHGPHCLGRYDAAGAPLSTKASAETSRGRGAVPCSGPHPR